MTRRAIIEKTVAAMNQLPDDKAQEISDFVDFISRRYEEQILSIGIQQLTSQSAAFDFLNEEEELYSVADLKVKYDG